MTFMRIEHTEREIKSAFHARNIFTNSLLRFRREKHCQRLNQLALTGRTPVVDGMTAPISSRRRRPLASCILSSAIHAARTRCSCRTASAAAEIRNFRVPKRPSTAALAEKSHRLNPFGHCRIGTSRIQANQKSDSGVFRPQNTQVSFRQNEMQKRSVFDERTVVFVSDILKHFTVLVP